MARFPRPFPEPLANDEDVYVDFATPIGAKIRRPLALWLSVTKKPEFANHRSLVNVSMLDQIVFDRLVELEHAALEVVADQWEELAQENWTEG